MNKVLKYLISAVIAVTFVGVGIARVQGSSLRVIARNGKEVITYHESHALVIWAGNYQHWDKLNNIEDEARDVKEALEKQGFQVTMVPNPNGDQLWNSLKNFIDNYGYVPDNRLVIFFAGHGTTRQKTKGYLVPIDAPEPDDDEQGFLKAAYPMQQIVSWAKVMEAKHVLFVFDSCFSGTIFKQRANSERVPRYIQKVMNKPVRQFLTAGDADEYVPAKSVFTPLFIRALEGAADSNKDGYVTGWELGLHLRQYLSEYDNVIDQTPQFGTIRDPDLDQGDIVFRPSTPIPSPARYLISEATGVNYTKLRDLLEAGKWEEADAETTRAMLQAAGREKEGWFRTEDIDEFECEDLRIIDQLWLDSSQGKFGFSVQKDIYQNLGGTREYNEEVLRRLEQRIGWSRENLWSEQSSSLLSYFLYSGFLYSLDAPKGHLPRADFEVGVLGVREREGEEEMIGGGELCDEGEDCGVWGVVMGVRKVVEEEMIGGLELCDEGEDCGVFWRSRLPGASKVYIFSHCQL